MKEEVPSRSALVIVVCPAENLCVVSEHIGTLLPLYVAVASIGAGNRHNRHPVLYFCHVKKMGRGFVYGGIGLNRMTD